MDLKTYSEQHVGLVWTEADHLFLANQLRQMDELAQGVVNLIHSQAEEELPEPVS
jgi:hypothetical protein